ncbi:MAG: hypothetical protein MPEBLZ_04359 [Candidatus Methanoperedens nitroreducens]|uniref:Uncharacterized protein n=1 Tax=Candidatus Methanoperedens nitratireducens TaxID=1392998 RepID=A0A0P7ZCD0_9EURY|nr:hypothetical protein [Candidatus Methanoperedens sp. BLZ2]KAB2942413.1 MAG: hypothetical protein F9K14_17340 [Candidatus Methanoperedens sp.]KPQ41103.1 MAG: hypothetical protein MPEBLZ_04359 [Candidatus Methanoperedens sp. BLZ1]MBZ0176645.1 hypothetical protein [Candidatus Methanoperedens nitroreducens]MCX9080369.1 hypothetical protein [Candidatus Methanoperedens sp.]
MVSYLIFAALFLTIGVTGGLYSVLSDILDIIVPINIALGYTNTDTTYIGDLMILGARLSPIWIFIGVILYLQSRAQKPEYGY